MTIFMPFTSMEHFCKQATSSRYAIRIDTIMPTLQTCFRKIITFFPFSWISAHCWTLVSHMYVVLHTLMNFLCPEAHKPRNCISITKSLLYNIVVSGLWFFRCTWGQPFTLARVLIVSLCSVFIIVNDMESILVIDQFEQVYIRPLWRWYLALSSDGLQSCQL